MNSITELKQSEITELHMVWVHSLYKSLKESRVTAAVSAQDTGLLKNTNTEVSSHWGCS